MIITSYLACSISFSLRLSFRAYLEMEEFIYNLSFTGLMITLIIPNISLQESHFRRYSTPKMTIEGNIFLYDFLIS